MNYVVFIFIGIITSILSLVHFTVYKYLISVFEIFYFKGLLYTRVIFIILTLSFISASVLANFYNNWGTRIFYKASAAWLGLLLYLFLFAVLYSVISRFTSPEMLKNLGKIFILVSVLVWTYGMFHAEDIQIKNVSVSIPNIPEVWKFKKAVWVSDIHLGQVHGKEYSQRIVNLINDQNPDVVFIGGDLFDGVKVDEDEVVRPFKNLHPSLGVFFITGNHEEFRDDKHFIDAVKRAGIKVLNNELVNLDGVQLVGVSDQDSSNRIKFISIMNSININKNIPSILLKHQPKDIDIAEKNGISLQISGHTHRAQMFPLGFVPKLVFKGFDYGLHSMGNTQVFTSSGVGTWGPPVRVGTDSEIVVFTFK